MTIDHPVFRAFFRLEEPRLRSRPSRNVYPVRGKIYGVFEDNDPTRRLMAVINYNMDIGDFWEWSEFAYLPGGRDPEGLQAGRELPDLRHDSLKAFPDSDGACQYPRTMENSMNDTQATKAAGGRSERPGS